MSLRYSYFIVCTLKYSRLNQLEPVTGSMVAEDEETAGASKMTEDLIWPRPVGTEVPREGLLALQEEPSTYEGLRADFNSSVKDVESLERLSVGEEGTSRLLVVDSREPLLFDSSGLLNE